MATTIDEMKGSDFSERVGPMYTITTPIHNRLTVETIDIKNRLSIVAM